MNPLKTLNTSFISLLEVQTRFIISYWEGVGKALEDAKKENK